MPDVTMKSNDIKINKSTYYKHKKDFQLFQGPAKSLKHRFFLPRFSCTQDNYPNLTLQTIHSD